MPGELLKEQLLTRKETVDFIDIPYVTINVWDSTKRRDLKPIKKDGTVYYRRSVLVEFLLDEMKP